MRQAVMLRCSFVTTMHLRPKGIGHVASRHEYGERFSWFWFTASRGYPMASSAEGICRRPIPPGLFLDGVVATLRSHALGLVRRSDFDRPVRLGTSDYTKRLWLATGIGRQLSGFFEDACPLDGNTAKSLARSFAAPNEAAFRQIPCCRMGHLRSRRQSHRLGAHRVEPDGLLPTLCSQEAKTPTPSIEPPWTRRQSTPEEGRQPTDVDHDHVALRVGIALGLANRKIRQQRTRASTGDDSRLARGSTMPGSSDTTIGRPCSTRDTRSLSVSAATSSC